MWELLWGDWNELYYQPCECYCMYLLKSEFCCMKTLFQQVCLKYPPSLKAFVGLHLLNELQCFSPDFPSLCGQVKHSPGEEAGSALLWRWGLQSSRIQKDPSCLLSCYPSNNIRAWRSQSKNYRLPLDGLTSLISILGQRD